MWRLFSFICCCSDLFLFSSDSYRVRLGGAPLLTEEKRFGIQRAMYRSTVLIDHRALVGREGGERAGKEGRERGKREIPKK